MHASLPGKKRNSFLVLILVMLPLGPYKHGRLSSKQNMLYLKYTYTHSVNSKTVGKQTQIGYLAGDTCLSKNTFHTLKKVT